jgi:hypothetical protein
MVDLQQDTRLKMFEDKLQKKEYLDCIETGAKLLDSLKTMDQNESAKLKIACYVAIGDGNFGLKRFPEALHNYEKARKLAEDKYGPLSDESMHTLFRLERALKALTSLEGGGDPKSILTSTVLLSAQSSDAAANLKTGKHARTLQGLWAVALDKQIVRGSNPFVSLFHWCLQMVGNSRVEEFLARTSIVVSSIGLFGMVVYALFWWQTHPYADVQNRIVHGDFATLNQTHCKTKTAKWTFRPFDTATTLTWSQDGTAEISNGPDDDRGKLPVVIYTDKPGSLLSVFGATFTKNNLLLRWNGYSMQDQYGTTYYDAYEPENTVAAKMSALRSSTQDFYRRHGRYPGANERSDTSYTNPFTKRGERIMAFAGKENIGDLASACKAQNVAGHPGMIVCFSAGPRRYLIGGFDRVRNPVQTANANGFLNLIPNQKTGVADLSDKILGLVVFDKPIDQVLYLICAHSAFAWVLGLLLVGAVGPALFLATRNWRTALRAKKKKPLSTGLPENKTKV